MASETSDNLFELDNTVKHQRQKQISFWNLYALNNIHSISEMISHHRDPKLHTARDRDWRDLFFLNRVHVRGQPIEDTFIGRSQRYFSELNKTLDRASWIRNEHFDLKVIKHEFWNKIYKVAPRSNSQQQCRKIVSNLVWAERLRMVPSIALFAVLFNYATGISGLSLKSRLGVVVGCVFVADYVIRFMRSDKIFYAIPQLPDAALERQRQRIVNECLVFDGSAAKYGKVNPLQQLLVRLIDKKEKEEEKEEVIKSLSMNPVKETDLI